MLPSLIALLLLFSTAYAGVPGGLGAQPSEGKLERRQTTRQEVVARGTRPLRARGSTPSNGVCTTTETSQCPIVESFGGLYLQDPNARLQTGASITFFSRSTSCGLLDPNNLIACQTAQDRSIQFGSATDNLANSCQAIQCTVGTQDQGNFPLNCKNGPYDTLYVCDVFTAGSLVYLDTSAAAATYQGCQSNSLIFACGG